MSNRLTFSLASLIVLIAFGLVFVATPAMAAKFDGIADPAAGGTLPDKTWVQGQANVSITLPKIVATADPAGALTATLNVAGSGDLASDGDEAGRTVGGTNPLTGLIFSFDPATGEGKLSGRASATQADIQSVSIVYTAIEATVTNNVPITLTVFVTINEAPDLTFGSETAGNLSLNTTDLVNVVFPAATGGIQPLTYTITKADGSAFDITGLTFNATTRRLFGIPAAGSPRDVYLYTVTDGGDSTAAADSPNVQESESLRFTIEVDATPPDFSPKFAASLTKVPDRNYTKDHDVSNPAASVALPEAEAGTGTGALTYSLAPLPAGLSFDPATRMLSGTPTAAGVTDATYTVTDAADLTDTLDFKITVNAAVSAMAPPNFPATGTSYLLGNPFADITVPAATGGTGAKSVMVTGLPDGLMQDGMKITGTPTAAAATEVTVTATDTLGAMGTANFTITVTAAPNLVYKSVVAPQSYEVGKPITPMLLPEGDGGIGPYTYALATPPAGISFDPITRLLSGTPTTAMAAADYNYTISDSAFSHLATPMPNTITLPISITVTAPAPTVNSPPDFGTATVANIVATANQAIPGVFLPEATDADGDALTYSISPALPAGLMFDDTTRALTGTPSAAMTQTAYTYMVADGNGGSDTIGFFITVNAATTPPVVTNMPPAFAADAKVDNIVATAGQAISGRFLPAATDPEGDVVRYWITPALPTGLIFNPSNRSLTGTPNAAMAQTAYTYNAADAGSLTTPATLPFFITVNAAPNRAPVYAVTTPIAISGTVGVPIAGVSAAATDPDGDTLMYSISPALPTGLMLNASTGMISGTPQNVHTGTHSVTATDPDGLTAMRGVNVAISAAPAANVAPVVTITTPAPTAPQMDSFVIAYTATDANAGDTPNVTVSSVINPASAAASYNVDSSVAGMVTITQAAGSPIAVIDVTITATDPRNSALSDSESISVTFAAKGTPPVDTTPPTVTITIAPASDMTVAGRTYTDVLGVTLDFNEPINAASLSGKIGRVGGDTYEVVQIGTPMPSATDNTVYTVYVNSPGYETRAQTRVLLKLGVMDLAGNSIPVDNIGTYTPPAVPAPTVAIAANPHPINCDTGSTITFRITGSSQKLVAGDITVGAGWKLGSANNLATSSTINIVPDGNSAIGITTVKVSVKADAVMNAAPTPKGNAAVDMTFTVGPVLMIPANSYILVNHPAHTASHLNDPLVLGQIQIRAPEVAIQKWECMPDLTVFFGRSAPAIGGGAIVIKEADGPLGYDPGGTKADIKKGSVGISEIMWASDEGIQHGGIADPNTGRLSRTNYDQTREQWIELHNRNNSAVKVTLFARPTNTALTTEGDEIDRVSNYNINNVWAPKGQSGNSEFGINFVSMQRGKHDNAGLTPNTGDGYAHGDWNGSHANRWTASTFSYLTARSGLAHTGQLAAENLNYDFLGTPGRSNKPGVSTPILRTNVPKNSIVFNEVANRRDQTLEWIELKNVSNGEVNLKKYQISLATAKGTDHAFYTFPDNDNIKLAAGETLLLLDTSPRDNDAHPIAVGQDRDTGNDQALGLGQNQDTKAHLVKYKVANFREGGLPDDGNFVLYLRNRNDRLKSREGVIDVIGWSDKLTDDSIHTKVWPLRVFGTPDARNKIAVETVHYRQHRIDPDKNTHGDDKDEHQALRDAGYTGIGYKRHAQRIAAHGGTPGYDEIRKNENAQLASGNLTISEIMYDQGDGNFPQWIEIYNSSETEAVNLHAGDHGWRLVIENLDDGEIPVNRLSGTLNFRSSDVQTILPQQTVIVASTRARNSGSAFFDTRVVFPATRVFSVWDDARGEFDMKRSWDPILSEEGFYIELIDGKNNFVDGVGNLVPSPNRRVAQDKVWELSEVTGEMMDDMGRSSILRRYRMPGTQTRYSDAQIESMGVEAAGWIAAHKTNFLDVRQTWFGHPDDYGSPGITGGRVLPVSLSKFRPERLDDGTIVVRWITESETNNAGFNILRSEKSDGEFKQINTKLIAGQGTTSERTVYTHTDTSAKPNVVYYYQIQDVSLDGKVQTLRMSRLKGHISAAGKATTTWGELKALQ